MKVSDIITNIGENEILLVSKEEKAILIKRIDPDHQHMAKLVRLYRFNDDQDIIEEIDLDKDVEELIDIFSKSLDIKEFLRQKLNEESGISVSEMAKLLRKHPEVKGEIKPRRGCLYLQIPNPEPGEKDIMFFLKDV